MPLAVEDGVGARRGVAKRIEHKNKQKKKRNKQTNKQTNKQVNRTKRKSRNPIKTANIFINEMKKKKFMFPTELEINAMLRFSFNNSITIMKIINCFDVFVFVC